MTLHTRNTDRRQRLSVQFDRCAERPPIPDDLRVRRILRMFGGSLELATVRAELAFTVRPAR